MDLLFVNSCVVTTTSAIRSDPDVVVAAIRRSVADDALSPTSLPVLAPPAEVTSNKDGDDRIAASGTPLLVVKQQQRRKHHRRGKKTRRWKPYCKLSWDEKRALEDRESRRAQRARDERFAHGQPVAPYNTTQFLMEDHNVQEPDLEGGHHHQGEKRQHRDSGDATTAGGDSDEYYYSSPEDEDKFLQKEFCEVYDNINAERLASMSKLQLIQEYMQLEERVDKLENKLQRGGSGAASSSATTTATTWDRDAENSEKVRIFQQEIRKLLEENERLRQENDELAAAKQARIAASARAESQDDHAMAAVVPVKEQPPSPSGSLSNSAE